MAKSSTPSWKPANGPTSTKSLGRSRRRNKLGSQETRVFDSHPLRLQIGGDQFRSQEARRVGKELCFRLLFFPGFLVSEFVFRRVNGAWWPARSSKPLSARSAGRGRFDSYPLRLQRSSIPKPGARRVGKELCFGLFSFPGFLVSELVPSEWQKGGGRDVA